MNALTSEKAPYLFALIVSVLAWLINSALLEIRQQTLISYDQTVVIAPGDDGHYLRVDLRNDSIAQVVRNITIELTCSGRTLCLSGEQPALNGNLVSAIVQPPWFFDPGVQSGIAEREAEALTLTPIIPAGSSVSFLVGLKDPGNIPTLLFVLPSDATRSPSVTAGFSLAGWLTQRYLQILLIASAITLIVFIGGVWIMGRQLVISEPDLKQAPTTKPGGQQQETPSLPAAEKSK